MHEMAHALELNAFKSNHTSMAFAVKYDQWRACSKEEFERIKNEEDSFLRSYAGSSEQEFFAVCIENFFEAPDEFSQQLPEIYSCLSVLLNQDPRNPELDYRLK
jgi:Mlc titration factor MtfA (ptsG expression regulator)